MINIISRIVEGLLGLLIALGGFQAPLEQESDITPFLTPSLAVEDVAQAAHSSVSIAILGDIMLGRHVQTLIMRQGWEVFVPDDIRTRLAGYDRIFFNLEGPVTQRQACRHNMCFAFREEVVAHLHSFGVPIATIANNHILDQGLEGYEDTKRVLEELNIPYVGQVREYQHVHRTEIEGKTFTFMGFADFQLGSFDRFLEAVREERTQTDILIVGLHAGPEYQLLPTAGQQYFARAIVDAGADVVSGHHPHVVQPLEVYNNKLIFYSLGNFIFDQYFSRETMRGLGAELIFEEGRVCVQPFMVEMDTQRIVRLTDDLGDLKERLFHLSPELRAEYEAEGRACLQ